MASSKESNKGPLLIFAGLGCLFLCGGFVVVGGGVLWYFAMQAEEDLTTLYETADAYPAPPVAVAAAADGDGTGARIRGLSETGGSGSWDSTVTPILVAAYDLNGSGMIDNDAEIASIPCDTWQALDAGVKQSWDYGLRVIYGFEQDLSWVGSAIGIDESARGAGDHALMRCVGGDPSTWPAPGGGVVGGAVGGAAQAPPPSGVAAAIRARPEKGGGSPWDNAVKGILLAQYDTNKSGWIDTSSEVTPIGCDVWIALDEGVKVSWSYGLRTIYGFDTGLWIGDALGFSQGIRSSADSAIRGCGLD